MAAREFDSGASLERKRINVILEKALKSPMVTVTAPEGYGKTHAVIAFLKKRNVTAIWSQLSERDNMVSRSWENFSGAIGFHDKKLGALIAEIGFPETNRQFDRYRALISKTIIPRKKYVIVLDDFHLINNEQILHLLNRAMVVPFSNATIMLISRIEPEINTVALLSRGLLTRITTEDLRFSEQEIADYFQMQDLPMTAEELAQIYRDTEGWPLSLNTIAADSKARKPGEALYSPEQMKMKFFKTIEDSYFSGMEKELQKFLIKLSLIEHWPHELLEKLAQDKKTTGNSDVIAGMEKINSLIQYDAYIHGYRIHRLFLEFLLKKQRELSAEEIREVYIQAAQWCVANKLRMDAAINYENAKDYRGLIALIYSFPRILPNETAAFFLKIVERLMLDKKDGDGPFLFLRYAIRPKLLLSMGRYEEASTISRGAITKFEGLAQNPVNSRILCANYVVLGTIAVFTCRFTRNYNIAPLFEKADFYYRRHPFPLDGPVTQSNITSYVCQVAYPAEKGVFEKAIQGFAPVIPYAAHTLNGFLYDVDVLARCEFAYFKGDLPEAENFARQAVFRAREKNQHEIENRGLFFLLRISIHRGNLSEIQELFRQLEAQLEADEYLNRYIFYDVTTGWFYAQTGNTGKAALWLKNDFEKSELNDLFHCFEIMVKAKCSFAEKRCAAALKTLENQGDENWLESFLLGKLEKTTLRAAALYHLGEKDAALHELAAAYEMAHPNSLDMPFIEMGEDMRLLAGAALNSKNCPIPPTWLERIRNRASAYGKKLFLIAKEFRRPAPEGDTQPQPIILSRREKAVLRSLSRGLTREKIAGEENLSLNAVKEIIKNLYTKLGALNRADAIRIATALGFLKNFSH
ncbi:helix-turn-helix transcriptional regulator [Spirochaetia bacterium]|nr:helix-turn-helix transcriptional regulator [Spirochaetia bacterium]